MVYQVIYLLVLTEAALRCLYFWQLKEYRLDRFREFLKTDDRGRYFLPGRYFLRPRLTPKIIVLFFITLVFSRQLPWWIGYLLTPLLTVLSVALVSPIADLIKWLIAAAAKIKLAIFHRRLLVIGVTGSYGKTSTKEILTHVLAAKFATAKTIGTNNTLIGAAKTVLLNLPLSAQIFVVEMGAYKIGEIASICRLVKPKIGILTGINQQHLALFGSQQKIIKAKSELLEALPDGGLAVVNGENPLTQKLAAPKAPTQYYRAGKFKTNLLGAHQQLNIAAAAAVAKHLEVKKFDLTNIPFFRTAMAKTRGLNGALIINDSYNSNPDGFVAAINFAKTLPAKKKILISPGIIELGREGAAIHRRLNAAAEKFFDEVIFTKAEAQLLSKLKKTLTQNHLLLIEGRFSKKFIDALCLKNRS